ncbi:Cytochrome c551 peroxidase precursor [compost metagenome]
MTKTIRRLLLLPLAAATPLLVACPAWQPDAWTPEEKETLKSLWIGNLASPPPNPSNRYAQDSQASALGHKLFFDRRLSGNGNVSCASCHQPEKNFTDGLPLAKGIGTTSRKTMTVVGAAYSQWQFWDGRKDSLWSQALGPLENPLEHGTNRMQVVRLAASAYRDEYEALFGPLPDLADAARFPEAAGPVEDPTAKANWAQMRAEDREAVTRAFANLGKAIEAYERKLVPGASRFDTYVQALERGDREAMREALTVDEVQGLRLFVGKAQCITCHSGPLFTNNEFHNTGVPARSELSADTGRAQGALQVLADEFNARSPFSDTRQSADQAHLRFLKTGDHQNLRAFKPPSLRNVAQSAPYMHAGQFADLQQVIAHYDQAPQAPQGHSELTPLHLSAKERDQLERFLRALDGPLSTPAELLSAPQG